MLDPVHNQGLRLWLGAFRTSPVESLYIDAHGPCLDARRAKLSLQYASKMKSLHKHPTHDTVFDNKYMKLFDARPKAICTFGLRIKQFLTACNIDLSDNFLNTFIFCFTTLVNQASENCTGSDASEKKRIAQMHLFITSFSWKYETGTVITFYRWFMGWKFSGLCYRFNIKHRNFHDIAWFSIHFYCWNLGNH